MRIATVGECRTHAELIRRALWKSGGTTPLEIYFDHTGVEFEEYPLKKLPSEFVLLLDCRNNSLPPSDNSSTSSNSSSSSSSSSGASSSSSKATPEGLATPPRAQAPQKALTPVMTPLLQVALGETSSGAGKRKTPSGEGEDAKEEEERCAL